MTKNLMQCVVCGRWFQALDFYTGEVDVCLECREIKSGRLIINEVRGV